MIGCNYFKSVNHRSQIEMMHHDFKLSIWKLVAQYEVKQDGVYNVDEILSPK